MLLPKLNKKNIFLLDGIGALVSAAGAGVILPIFQDWIGLSARTLNILAMVAAVFAIYSLSCFFLIKNIKPVMLAAIMLANSIYGLATCAIAFFLADILIWGKIYLMGEALVLVAVVWLEVCVYQKEF